MDFINLLTSLSIPAFYPAWVMNCGIITKSENVAICLFAPPNPTAQRKLAILETTNYTVLHT
jgi:hypothetical protein